MADKDCLVDLSAIDMNHVVADIEEIRRYNPQRFEMEQLTAIVYDDPVERLCVGYKDITPDEFWVRGHMPGLPLMPGVVMCESAAQLCCYITQKYDLLGAELVGFGGLEQVRFRDLVTPGDRFIVIARMVKCRRGAMIVSEFQGVVGESIVVEGRIKGIPLPMEQLRSAVARRQPLGERVAQP